MLKSPIFWADLEKEYPNASDTVKLQRAFDTINAVKDDNDNDNRVVIYLQSGGIYTINDTLDLPKSSDLAKRTIILRTKPGDQPATLRFTNSSVDTIEGQQAAMLLRSNIRATNIIFDVSFNPNNIIYLTPQVTWNGTTYNQDDADSSFVDCQFKGFDNHTAVIENGRNVLIENCTFTASGANSVGFWHYFYNIYEDETDGSLVTGINTDKQGQCRKNRIFNNTFNITGGTALRFGYMPKDWNSPINDESLYFDMQQCHIYNNTVTGCMFADFKLTATQELDGLSFERNSCDIETSSVGQLVRISSGKLRDMMVVGKDERYLGRDRADHCFHIGRGVDMNKTRIYVDATFRGFNKQALVFGSIPDRKFRRLKILGSISGSNNAFNDMDGVGYYADNNNTISYLNDTDANKIGKSCYG